MPRRQVFDEIQCLFFQALPFMSFIRKKMIDVDADVAGMVFRATKANRHVRILRRLTKAAWQVRMRGSENRFVLVKECSRSYSSAPP